MRVLNGSRVSLLLLLLATASTWACGDGVLSPGWTVQVQASTAGEDVDRDGYRLLIDEGLSEKVLPPTGVATFDLPAGDHTVMLTQLAENCLVEGPNPVAMTTRKGEVVTVRFEVRCGKIVSPS